MHIRDNDLGGIPRHNVKPSAKHIPYESNQYLTPIGAPAPRPKKVPPVSFSSPSGASGYRGRA